MKEAIWKTFNAIVGRVEKYEARRMFHMGELEGFTQALTFCCELPIEEYEQMLKIQRELRKRYGSL